MFLALVHQINSLREALKLKQNFQKSKVVTGKSPFFVIGPSSNHHSICFNIGFWYGSLYRNDAFSILVLSTKKRHSSFLKWSFVFQKISFKTKVLKRFEVSTDCHIKTSRLWNRGLFWNSLVPFFRRTYALSVGLNMKPLRKTIFQCFNKNHIKFCCKTCLKVEPFTFAVYLTNCIFQTSVLFNTW